ncbi:MAG: hypothetical protein IJR52_02270 [Selenomonadaceae bacterium]|nr:hypothetical protein [Selenomonadaceae bacterium]MBQ9496382.1 hypothetical protein [Selenomonadaceae bacterium]
MDKMKAFRRRIKINYASQPDEVLYLRFLAEAFIYVVSQENKSTRTTAAAKSKQITPCEELRNRIFQLYGEISFRQPRKNFLPKDFFDLHGIRRALFKKIPNS